MPLVDHPDLPPAGRAPDADHRGAGHHVLRPRAVLGQVGDRNLDGDRVDVERLGRIDRRGGRARDQVQVLERAQVAEIEDRSQVDVEPVESLPGEHLDPAGEVVHGRLAQPRVVRRRARADVARRARKPASQHSRPQPRPPAVVPVVAVRRGPVRGRVGTLDPRDREELALVPVPALKRRDRARVVEERVGVAKSRLELEHVRELRRPVPVVVDVEGVEDVVPELEEVRAAGRVLERHEVRDQRDRVRPIRADERVDVGVVGRRILADLRCFTVRGHRCHLRSLLSPGARRRAAA